MEGLGSNPYFGGDAWLDVLTPLPRPPPFALAPQVRQLRDALSSAQQRATAAEARVELLQEAVRKAEERAARLEMAAASRAAAGGAGDGAGDGTAGAADGSREAQLAAEVKLLREELAAAQVGTGARGWLQWHPGGMTARLWQCSVHAAAAAWPTVGRAPPAPACPPAGDGCCCHGPRQAV